MNIKIGDRVKFKSMQMGGFGTIKFIGDFSEFVVLQGGHRDVSFTYEPDIIVLTNLNMIYGSTVSNMVRVSKKWIERIL